MPDVRELPIYSIPDAAHYLRLPESTIRSWVLGRRLGVARKSLPLISLPKSDGRRRLLSFYNIAEAHVLASITRVHGVRLPKVRRALIKLARELKIKHPLIDARFQTDGIELMMKAEQIEESLNIGRAAGEERARKRK